MGVREAARCVALENLYLHRRCRFSRKIPAGWAAIDDQQRERVVSIAESIRGNA